ncbi:hypothetical protein NE850_20260 [Paraburkholderia sp. USG1]|uniref:hypothetical protein n=1 Tax=Paraburkholderia sp. USG1 TaxID=2952268 RepID=UPI0028630C92|nr:hypothetical protein [Paraburkholderia sp. USG1]MDR8398671.1 hypothetical protein [Paraburkholderia sp. USG1]
MSERWSINADWAELETGSPEERAGFAALGIYAYDACLTAGHDRLLQSIRHSPYLSAYHLAEWLAWNWWRLRWEPHKQSLDWELSHAMASIGGGYIWPNIRIVSDGKSVTLVCKPTAERANTPYRYISDSVSVLPATDFEVGIDLFIEAVLQRLQTRGVAGSNLHEIWRDVIEERQDPALSMHRKLEALLGEDPGEMDEGLLHQFAGNIVATGQTALEEIAANRIPGKAVPDIAHLLELGHARGTVTNPQDRITLHAPTPHDADAAWRVGIRAAQLLRSQENIDPDVAITNDRLVQMYGAPRDILNRSEQALDLSFTLSESDQRQRTVLRSRWDTGRRFELARLLGDSLIHTTEDPMRPATRSDTYRQKMQRAFAAELLSPFQAVDDMLDGDYSMENQQDVAHHFHVSSLTIRTLLVNHNRIDRSELDEADWAHA